jgi:hypothetical protein
VPEGPDRPEAPIQLVLRDGSTRTSWGDKRGSWPPFEVGNQAAVTHGTRSERLLSAKAEEVHAELIELCPWVSGLDFGAVARYVRTEARAVMLSDYVAEVVRGQAGTDGSLM